MYHLLLSLRAGVRSGFSSADAPILKSVSEKLGTGPGFGSTDVNIDDLYMAYWRLP